MSESDKDNGKIVITDSQLYAAISDQLDEMQAMDLSEGLLQRELGPIIDVISEKLGQLFTEEVFRSYIGTTEEGGVEFAIILPENGNFQLESGSDFAPTDEMVELLDAALAEADAEIEEDVESTRHTFEFSLADEKDEAENFTFNERGFQVTGLVDISPLDYQDFMDDLVRVCTKYGSYEYLEVEEVKPDEE